jgi:hypothetical protein
MRLQSFKATHFRSITDSGWPASLLLKKMAADPAEIVTDESAKRFQALFMTINAPLAKHLARTKGPFQ